MTTAGYGDLVPLTIGGRITAAVTIVCGIIVIAMPVGIIGTQFTEMIETLRKKKYLTSQLKQKS